MSTSTEPQRLYSVEDWENLDEDDDRELVDGVLVESEMVDVVHETVVVGLLRALDVYFRPRGGAVYPAGLKFVVGARRGRIPDLSAFASLPDRRRGARRRPADVLVEVLSPAPRDHRRDRIAKVTDYASCGAPNYWIVDPAARTFECFQLREGSYLRVAGASEGTLTVPGFEGLVIDLDALWGEIDRLPEGSDDDAEPAPVE